MYKGTENTLKQVHTLGESCYDETMPINTTDKTKVDDLSHSGLVLLVNQLAEGAREAIHLECYVDDLDGADHRCDFCMLVDSLSL